MWAKRLGDFCAGPLRPATQQKCFTLQAEEVSVGNELRLRSGASAGTAEGFAPKCDASSPGYIYRAASDRVWNPLPRRNDGPTPGCGIRAWKCRSAF